MQWCLKPLHVLHKTKALHTRTLHIREQKDSLEWTQTTKASKPLHSKAAADGGLLHILGLRLAAADVLRVQQPTPLGVQPWTISSSPRLLSLDDDDAWW